MNWTTEEILAFAPDINTAKRGQDLATIRKWQNFLGNENFLFGECKSSQTTYYHTVIDLNTPAFKCNCPSSKSPCKHVIGLLLIYVNNSSAFRISSEFPKEINAWIEKRKHKEQKKFLVSSEEKLKKEALKLKSRKKRLALMLTGIEDLELWLFDLIRNGLASSEGQPLIFWDEIATRMVDSKLSGIAKRIKILPLLQGANTDWPTQLLTHLSEIHLIVKGLKQIDHLPKALQDTLLSLAGINLKKEDLLDLPKVKDEWMVLGQIEGMEERLNFRRTWLYGKRTTKMVLLLDYVFGDIDFDQSYKVGSIFYAELIYYPSNFPLRAFIFQQEEETASIQKYEAFSCFEDFFEVYAHATSLNPWLLDFPVCFENVIPIIEGERLFIIDKEKKKIPLFKKNDIEWKLLAISGAEPCSVFGEWTGENLLLMSAIVKNRFINLMN